MEPFDTDELNSRIARELLPSMAYNSAANWQTIRDRAYNDSVCVTELMHVDGVPALILGSGPSLDDAGPYLRDFNGAVFSGPSQVTICDRWEREPTYIVAIDPHDIVAEQLQGPEFTHATLITHQAISPKVLHVWGKRKIKFGRVPVGDAIATEAMYPWLKQPFSPGGCVVNSMAQLAIFLGYSPIYLAGVDFGFPNNQLRATQYRRRGHLCYEEIQPVIDVPPEDALYENGVWTTREQMHYKLLLLTIWRRSHANLVSVSNGILDEIPHASIEDAIENLPYPSLYPEDIDRDADLMLNKWGVYITKDNRVVRTSQLEQQIATKQEEINQLDKLLQELTHAGKV